jgi:hypothetical protein
MDFWGLCKRLKRKNVEIRKRNNENFHDYGERTYYMKTCAVVLLPLIALAPAAIGQGTILWNEAVNGELSRTGASPTYLGALQVGTNSVLGSVEFVPTGSGPGGTLYSDFFSLTINAGASISAIQLAASAPIAIWIGDPGFSTELASVISPSNGSLLPQLGIPSIGSGTYGFYVSNHDFGSSPSSASYRLDLVSSSVPEPGLTSLLLATAACCASVRCWRSHRMRRK